MARNSSTPAAGDDAQAAASTPDATTAPADATTLAAPEQTTNPPSGTSADGAPSPAADPAATPVAVTAGSTGVADGIPEGDKVPRPAAPEAVDLPADYKGDAWQVGAAAPADAFRVFDGSGQLGPVQAAAPGPGQSGIIVARKGDTITGATAADLIR